jgi:hypothetical protein
MTSARGLKYDLGLLSNGFQQYALAYLLGFFGISVSLSSWPTEVTNPLIVLFPLTLCVLSHIASEKADKVADRIVLEHGGYRRRIAARIWSTLIANLSLVSAGTVVLELMRGWRVPLTPAFVCGALFVVVVCATAGTVVAAAIPHPFVSAVLMSALVFAGGSDPHQNLTMKSLLSITGATSIQSWCLAALAIALPWGLAEGLLFNVARGRAHFPIWTFSNRPTPNHLKIPRWAGLKSSFGTTAFFAGATNPLVVAATFLALSIFTATTLQAAAKFADLSVGTNYFFLFPGQIMLNVLPAVSLATSLESLEQADQERFFYRSIRLATLAETLRISIAAWAAAILVTLATVKIGGFSITAVELYRSIAVETAVIPGLAVLAMKIRRVIRVPVLISLVSFASTFAELGLSKLAPALKPWLPSSLFSAAAGGAGLYVTSPNQMPPAGWALAFVLLVSLGPLFWAFWPQRKMP